MDAAKIQMEGAAAEQKMALERRAAEQEQQLKLVEHILSAKQAQAEHQAGMQQQAQQASLSSVIQGAQAHQKMKLAEEAQKNKPIPKGKNVNGNKPK